MLAKGEDEERELDGELRDALAVIPNLPLDDVPDGTDEKDNEEVRTVGTPPKLRLHSPSSTSRSARRWA